MSLISKISQYTELSGQAKAWLEEHIEILSFSRNETVHAKGRVCNYMYYVTKGVLCSYYLQDHKEVCNFIAAEDDFASSIYSFVSRQPSHETIECVDSCTLEALSYDSVQDMYRLFPETERAGRIIHEQYYLMLEMRLNSIRFRTAKERYDSFCDKRIELLNRVPLGYIASYLGMTQETLSRIRRG